MTESSSARVTDSDESRQASFLRYEPPCLECVQQRFSPASLVLPRQVSRNVKIVIYLT